MARRTKEEAEETKKAICLAALDIFCEKGYSRTTFDEIAKRINLTKGAIYWHFRNKADLLAELIRQKVGTHRAGIEKQQITSLADLRRVLEEDARSIEQDKDYCKFLFFVLMQMEWSETIMQKVSEQIKEARNYPFKELKEALTFLQKSGEIRAEIDIDELVTILICNWRGVMSIFVSKLYPMNLSHMMMASFDLIMDGVIVERERTC